MEKQVLKMVDKAFLKTFLELETADTEQERKQGLQNRKELDQYKGMVFNFPEAGKQSIWMKDTHIPLDVIFLSEDGEVLNIEQGEPHSTEHIYSDSDNCKHVLEIKKGKADDFSICRGDNLSFLLN